MVKVLNHLYYSIFCCFHWLNFLFVPNEGAVSKEGKSNECEYEAWRALKINAEYETDISSSSSYAVLMSTIVMQCPHLTIKFAIS